MLKENVPKPRPIIVIEAEDETAKPLLAKLIVRHPDLFRIIRAVTTRPNEDMLDWERYEHVQPEEFRARERRDRILGACDAGGYRIGVEREAINEVVLARRSVIGIATWPEQKVLALRKEEYDVRLVRIVPPPGGALSIWRFENALGCLPEHIEWAVDRLAEFAFGLSRRRAIA